MIKNIKKQQYQASSQSKITINPEQVNKFIYSYKKILIDISLNNDLKTIIFSTSIIFQK